MVYFRFKKWPRKTPLRNGKIQTLEGQVVKVSPIRLKPANKVTCKKAVENKPTKHNTYITFDIKSSLNHIIKEQ